MLSKTMRLNFCYLKIIHIFQPPYHPYSEIAYIFWKIRKINKVSAFIRLIMMKMKLKMKCDIHGHKYSKYKNFLSLMTLKCIRQHLSNLWKMSIKKIMKKLSNTEADLKTSVPNKENCVCQLCMSILFCRLLCLQY